MKEETQGEINIMNSYINTLIDAFILELYLCINFSSFSHLFDETKPMQQPNDVTDCDGPQFKYSSEQETDKTMAKQMAQRDFVLKFSSTFCRTLVWYRQLMCGHQSMLEQKSHKNIYVYTHNITSTFRGLKMTT